MGKCVEGFGLDFIAAIDNYVCTCVRGRAIAYMQRGTAGVRWARGEFLGLSVRRGSGIVAAWRPTSCHSKPHQLARSRASQRTTQHNMTRLSSCFPFSREKHAGAHPSIHPCSISTGVGAPPHAARMVTSSPVVTQSNDTAGVASKTSAQHLEYIDMCASPGLGEPLAMYILRHQKSAGQPVVLCCCMEYVRYGMGGNRRARYVSTNCSIARQMPRMRRRHVGRRSQCRELVR